MFDPDISYSEDRFGFQFYSPKKVQPTDSNLIKVAYSEEEDTFSFSVIEEPIQFYPPDITPSKQAQPEQVIDTPSSKLSASSLLALPLAAVLCGCGGDSTSTPTPVTPINSITSSAAPLPPSTLTNTVKFTQTLNSFQGNMPLPGKFQVISSAVAIDVNKDGYKDLVIHAWEKPIGSQAGANLGNAPTANKITILINKNGTSFVDETSTYLPGNASLSGASRKVEVVDINKDGVSDLIFACNREDGRSGQQHEYNTAYMNAMVSTPNGYVIKTFGVEDWYHSAGYAVLNGKTYVAGTGWLHGSPGKSLAQGGFEYINGNFVETLKFPFQLSPNNFIFFESPGSKNTDYLIQTAEAPNWLGVEGYQYTGGNWVKVGQIDTPGTFVKDVMVTTYNGVTQAAKIYSLGNEYIITGMGNSITESSKIDINHDGKYAIVMKVEAAVVNNFDMNTTYVDQIKDVTPGDKLAFFTIENNKLVQLDIKIDNKPGVNATALNVIDYNRDGYDDIVLSGFSKNALPTVYLNNKNGSFSQAEISTNLAMNYDVDGFSIIDDFNNDGIVDMISLPGNGQYENNSMQMTAFAYFTGSPLFTQSAAADTNSFFTHTDSYAYAAPDFSTNYSYIDVPFGIFA